MPDTVIYEDDLLAEYARLDAMRKRKPDGTMTDEQFKLVHYARSGTEVVQWTRLVEYWRERWGDIKNNTLQSRYTAEKIRRGLQ